MNPRWQAPGQAALSHEAPSGPAIDRRERVAIAGSFVLISIGYFYGAISRAITDHLWMDEVLAVSAARQPSLSRVWDAIWNGTDFSPPTYHFLLHAMVRGFGAPDIPLVWRAPSILAVYGAALCTYALLVKSRLSRLVGVLAFGLVLALSLFDYAIQVRQYALLALGLAVALLLWSGMADTRRANARAFCLWLVLAAVLCLHFYGVVEVAAIAIAELVYWIGRRDFRIAVWLALLLTVPVEAALYPLASHLATFNAGDSVATGYYAAPSVARFLDAVFYVVGGGETGMLLLLAAFLIMAVTYRVAPVGPPLPAAAKPIATARAAGLPQLEIVIVALCALPVIAFAFSVLVTNSFSTRYMVAGALLPGIAAAYMLDKSPQRRVVSLVLVPLVFAVLMHRVFAPNPIGEALAVLQKAKPPFAIVVGEGLLYIELMEAADAGTRSRLVYLTRPVGSSSPDPTNDNLVRRMAAFEPDYRVGAPNDFLQTHAAFYELYRPGVSTDTTTPALIAKGVLGSPVDAEHGILLFQALPAAASQQGQAR